MQRSRLALIAGIVLLSIWFAFGCGSVGRVRQAAQKAKDRNEMIQIGIMYHNYCYTYNKAPMKLEDFQPLAVDAPEAYDALATGRVVFLYGASVRRIGETDGTAITVIAYQQQVPSNGGLVLMADGSVNSMTVAEFNVAKKAQPDKR